MGLLVVLFPWPSILPHFSANGTLGFPETSLALHSHVLGGAYPTSSSGDGHVTQPKPISSSFSLPGIIAQECTLDPDWLIRICSHNFIQMRGECLLESRLLKSANREMQS